MMFPVRQSTAAWLLYVGHVLEGGFLGVFAGIALPIIHLFLKSLCIFFITERETSETFFKLE
jgi:hypothetical protein